MIMVVVRYKVGHLVRGYNIFYYGKTMLLIDNTLLVLSFSFFIIQWIHFIWWLLTSDRVKGFCFSMASYRGSEEHTTTYPI